jgi:hypothetical protein
MESFENEGIHEVLKPSSERWFTVDVVLEDDPAVLIWRESLRDFSKVLQESGAFNDVRLWYLRDQAASTKGATSPSEFLLESEAGAHISPKFLAGSGTTRLVLFGTHGSSPHWGNGRYAKLFCNWLGTSSTALLNLLPEPDRKRTMLGDAQGVCSTFRAGLPTAQLNAHRFWWMASDDLPAPFVPMLGLDPRSVYRFARMQMGLGGTNPVVFLDRSRIDASQHAGSQEPDSEQIVSALSVHSPEAFKLARFLCLSPFTLSVARLIQETILGRDSPRDVLGRLVLSGLVRTTKGGDDSDLERTYFEFLPPAREVLLRSLRSSEAEAVAAELDARVSQYIEKTQARVTRDAVRYPDETGQSSLPDFVAAFARVSRALLGDPGTRSDLRQKIVEFTSGLSRETLTEVRATLLRHQNIPLDPEEFEENVWRALVETSLVWQSANGEWRLRVGVAEDLSRSYPEPNSGDVSSSRSEQESVTRFAIVIDAGNISGMPYISRAESDAWNFVAWLREIGLADQRIILLKDTDTPSDVVAACYSLQAQARHTQGRRQLFLYFIGYGVVSGALELLLRIGSAKPSDTMLAQFVFHLHDSLAFDELIFVIDVASVPLSGVRSVSSFALTPAAPSGPPNLLLLVADGQMHQSIAPKSFTAEVIEALRTATANRYVTADSVADRLYRRLGSEIRIERVGDDFKIWGPVTRSANSQISSVWVVSPIPEFEEELGRQFHPSDRPHDSFPVLGKGGVTQVTMLSEGQARERLLSRWDRGSLIRPLSGERSDAILFIADVDRARPSKEWNSSLLMVAGSIQTGRDEQLPSSERLLRLAGWITETMAWMRYMPALRMPSTPEVTFGTLASIRISDQKVAGYASDRDLKLLSNISFRHPQIQFFAIGAWRSGPREVSQITRMAAAAFATALLKRLNEEETGAPRAWSFTGLAEGRLAAVREIFSSPISGRVDEKLGYIAQFLSQETAPTEAWASLQHELAGLYGQLAERQNAAANLTAAILQCQFARDYYDRSRDTLGRARAEFDIGSFLEKRGDLNQDLTDLEAAAQSFAQASGGFPERSRVKRVE